MKWLKQKIKGECKSDDDVRLVQILYPEGHKETGVKIEQFRHASAWTKLVGKQKDWAVFDWEAKSYDLDMHQFWTFEEARKFAETLVRLKLLQTNV